jgi:hypothetical protein
MNFYGRYEFSQAPEAINLEQFIEALAQVAVPFDLTESC